jgi:hypothetical protein
MWSVLVMGMFGRDGNAHAHLFNHLLKMLICSHMALFLTLSFLLVAWLLLN